MHCAEQRLFRIFDTHSEKDPLKMYMFACRHKLPKGIASAARATLNRPIQMLDVARLETSQRTSSSLIRLQAYHKACGQAASSVIGAIYAYTADLTSNELKLPWLPMGEWTWFTCQHNNSVSATEMVIIQNNVELPAAKWWTNYLRKAQEKLRNRPTGAAVQDMKPFSAFAAAATDHCGLCKRHVISDLHTFNNLLAHQVERAVTK
ncbi:hypothetical protein BC629DRAFT_1647970 [Irpex lacteus]|nr:hypothetical protein BC629DRAFT_1647970 [Irpex lacteus]